ncbi:MAG: acetate--CoA ligase family protein [Pseudolabrys sp.]
MTATADSAPSAGVRNGFERLLRPRSLAVVGASPERFSLGGNVLGNIERFGFAGALHLVSRSRTEINGIACVPSIDDLPVGVDAVVLVVPVPAVKEAVAACVRRGVGGAIVFASGFGELGEVGQRAQDEIAAIAREAGLAMLGPNCLGLINFVDQVPLTFEPVQSVLPSGPGICAIAQSGAMAGNIRMALLAGTECRRRGKPIVLMHPGRSARSREAAKSHTGALAGDHAVMRAFVASEGVVLVESLDELFDVSRLLTRYPQPAAGGAGIMSNSGALRGFSLDFCEQIDLSLPELADATCAELKQVLPDFAAIDNPLDITAQGMQKPSLFGDSAQALLRDKQVGALLVAAMGGSPAQQMAKWKSLRPALEAAEKPVALAFLGDNWPLSEECLVDIKDSGVPFFRSPERAMRAFAHMMRYGRTLVETQQRADVSVAVSGTVPPGPVVEYRGKAMFAEAGIAVPRGALARSSNDAVAVARDLGFPVVLKAQAAALMHKSDVGGVAVGIADEAALRAAWETMMARISAARPELVLDGILVEAMAPSGGIELIAGARRDPAWGEVLMVGLGGVWAEALGDVRLLPADASAGRIAAELDRLKGARLLHGYRGSPPCNVAALVDALIRIGALIRAVPTLSEIDVNPLVVYPAGQGVLALDALLLAE